MPRVERQEYKETKVIRTKSPVRTRGSSQNVAQFDNNLDNLLEDLQNSVSRPDSALGSNSVTTYRETRQITGGGGGDGIRSNSLNRMTNLSAANPVTEYASDDAYSYASPDGKKSVKTVKKEVYSYKTSGGGDFLPETSRMQNNISQLDSLLDDLQQVKQTSGSYNRTGADPGFQEYSRSKVIAGKTVVERDVVYPDTPKSTRSRTLDRTDREGSLVRELQYSSEGGSHGDVKSLRTASPSPTRTGTLSKQTKVTNVHSYPVEVIETTTPDINPDILASLDPNLLPAGNTKVTTTIKTYTYEIPGTVYPSPNSTSGETDKYVYSPNQSQTTPSKSFVYNKYEDNTLNYQDDPNWQLTTSNITEQPPYAKPSPPVGTGKTIVKETVRNYQPGPVAYPETPGKETYVYNETTVTKHLDDGGYPNRAGDRGYPPLQDYPPPTNKQTYVMKETHTTNTNAGSGYPPQNVTNIYRENPQDYPPPTNKQTYVIKETHTTNTNAGSPPYPGGYPPQNVTNIYRENPQDYPPPTNKQTYVIKETHTTNTNAGSPSYPGGYPPQNVTNIYREDPQDYPPPTNKQTYIIKETHTTNTNNAGSPPYPGGYPPQNVTNIYREDTRNTNTYTNRPFPQSENYEGPDGRKPGDDGGRPVNITYKYKSTSSSTNNYKGGYPPGEESEPLLHPRPFPIDDGDGPPKKLDELMANIGKEPPNSPLNSGYTAHEFELAQQKKVDTLKQQHQELEQKKEPKEVQKSSKNVTGPPVYYPPGHEMFARKEESGGWRAEGAMAKESGKYKYEAESKSKTKTKSGAAIVPVCLPLCCGLPCTIL